MERLTLTADTLGPVSRGHPWVYAGGVEERLPPLGSLVQLCDNKGRPAAFGIIDEGDVVVRVLGRHAEPLPLLLGSRLQSALRLRQRVLPQRTSAYRLINAAGDGLPGLVIDRYGPVAVLRLYGRCWEPHLDALVEAISDLPGVESVLRRLGVRRVDGDDGAVQLSGRAVPEPLIVEEDGLKFLARPSTGQKTGLFLDQREHRRMVGSMARDASVCNLFAYTGGFSVHAAAGGARRVVTVDISAPALEDAKENFRLNGFDLKNHAFLAVDVFKASAANLGGPFDLVVNDPPSLSHEKASDGKARQAYRDLNTLAGQLVSPEGILATASCTARLSQDRWEESVRDGLRKAGRWSWLWRAAEPPDHPVALDHPEGRYLKFALLRRR
jgi:23S rRNA (cytosine1962-C5)-methyltransferase